MYYILKQCDYYLEDYQMFDNIINNISFSHDRMKLFIDYEEAHNIMNLLFIELGVMLHIEEFKIGKEDK